jgi:hypothetical protein
MVTNGRPELAKQRNWIREAPVHQVLGDEAGPLGVAGLAALELRLA